MSEQIRILYVDDDAGLGVLLRKTLAAPEYFVDAVESGEEAIARLEQTNYDVIALDHSLAGELGLDVIPRIRALPKPPPIIYVTGSDDARVAVAALKAGAVDYVWKDVQGHYRELLREAVKAAIEQEQLRLRAEEARRQVAEARDRAEALLSEVNHRVANSLAMVSAFIALQAGAIEDPTAKQMLRECQARIGAIAGVHRSLYTSGDVRFVDVNAYLASLVKELGASTAHKCAVRFLGVSHPVHLTTDRAVSLGVIVTELVTNACKYAYAEEQSGEVRIAIEKPADSKLIVRVEDDGVGWRGEGPPKGTGIGSRVIKAMSQTLHADLNYMPASAGTVAELLLPT
jgi:two-component sensor histidine kinase/CheY-like chemotaxis protein